jgi:hypothetical protein
MFARPILATALLFLMASVSVAAEFSGLVAAEIRMFFEDPLDTAQRGFGGSLSFQPEFYHEWESGSSLSVVLFGRLDSVDSKRTHLDVRELNYLWLTEYFELRIGAGKVFWGATEFLHLVDIINQTDTVENIDGEDKFGQPMIQLTIPSRIGTIELFVLPYFRERTFPGRRGRLRPLPVVDTDRAIYESSVEERHVDLALRYNNTFGDIDLGLYYFKGTGREPTLVPSLDASGLLLLIPLYEQIEQTGLDIQMVSGPWLLKIEALYRSGQGPAFFAYTGGVEHTFASVASTRVDIGAIIEYAYDERGDASTSAFQNDLMLGTRIAANDTADTQLLLGWAHDIKHSSHALSIEGSRRLTDSVKLSLEGRFISSSSTEDVLHQLRADDYFQIEISYYF